MIGKPILKCRNFYERGVFMKVSRFLFALFICISLTLQAGVAMAANKQDDKGKSRIEAKKEEKKREARFSEDGSVRPEFNLPKPKFEPHADIAPEAAGGSGDGQNSLDFSQFISGDLALVFGTPTGHAGLFDWALYWDINSPCIWSANTEPVNGVQLETPKKYRGYDIGIGAWVPDVSYGQCVEAVGYCSDQEGEPYNALWLPYAKKENQNYWYCSKLDWAAYWYTSAHIDLDADGGDWVWPADLANDDDVWWFQYSD